MYIIRFNQASIVKFVSRKKGHEDEALNDVS